MFLMREDDKLILRAQGYTYRGLGVVFVGLGLLASAAGGIHFSWHNGWLLLSVPFIVIGGVLLPLRTVVTTIFDLPSRRVIFSTQFESALFSAGRGWYQCSHTYTYSFADIAGIGVKGGIYGEDGVLVLYRPVMKLRDGQNCWLATGEQASDSGRSRRLTYLKYAEPLAAICAATDLRKLDLEGNFTDRFLAEPGRPD